MTIFDFYLLKRFLRIFVICFISLSGLYVIVHAFTNLEEILALSKHEGSFLKVLVSYYGPRVLDFFNQTFALVTLIAAVFAYTMLQRTHEITAVEAAGTSKARIVRSILIFSGLIVILATFSRETVIPKFREQLVKNPEDYFSDDLKKVHEFVDPKTQIAIHSGKVRLRDKFIFEPSFVYRGDSNEESIDINAQQAQYVPADAHHPAGYLLLDFSTPQTPASQPSISEGGKTVVYFPSEHPWLNSNQCFVAMNVPPHQIVLGPESARFASILELVASNRNPSIHFSNRQRVEVHSRIVQPIMDLTLIFLGIPIVIARRDRNVFFASGICIAVVIGMFLTAMTFQGLGATRIISSPALAAWLPIIIFTPLTFVAYRWLSR